MQVNQVTDSTWNKSLRTSIIVHVFILLLSWLFRLHDDPTQDIDNQYAVTVSFQNVDFRNTRSSNSTQSRSTTGQQRAKSEAPQKLEAAKKEAIEVPKPVPPKPTPVPPQENPQPSEPVFSESTIEESDIQAIEEEIPVEEPEPEYIPEDIPEPVPLEEAVILNPELPSIEDIIGSIDDDPVETEEETNVKSEVPGTGEASSSQDGTSDSDPSLKDGSDSGTGKSNTGDGQGADREGSDRDSGRGTADHGEGEFDASGDGIFGRKVIHHPYDELSKVYAKSGKIWIKTCINPMGRVTYVEIDELNTTVKDYTILRNALEAARKYRFENDFTAPKEQCGVIRINVENFRGVR